MIGSVVAIFLLLIFTHHRQESTRSNETVNKGLAGDHGVTVPTHVPVHPGTSGLKPDESIASNYQHHADIISYKPNVAYLLSYPSSGASFLIRLFQSLAVTNTASTVGSYYRSYELDQTLPSAKGKTGTVLPTYTELYYPPVSIYTTNLSAQSSSSNLTLGPYWVMDPILSKTSPPLSTQLILTDTHCTVPCPSSPCPPEDSIQSFFSFEQACRTLFIQAPPMGKNISNHRYLQQQQQQQQGMGADMHMQQVGTLDPSSIKRAIHLIRDPFSNIVSRFHVSRRFHVPKQDTNETIQGISLDHGNSSSTTDGSNVSDTWLGNHPDTIEGLHTWCRENEVEDIPLINSTWFKYSPWYDDIQSLIQNTPCSLEVLKYIVWHNHAEQFIAMYLDYPSHVIYFEDLDESQERIQVIHDIASLLNMTLGSSNNPKSSTTKIAHPEGDFFIDRVWYGDLYFSEEERKNMERLIRKVAYPRTLALLERYFDFEPKNKTRLS